MFTAVLILILLTEMVIYAVHVGVFEQRKSANDMKQKLAFHTADSGVQQARQFFTVNASRVVSSTMTGGWLNAASLRWQPCPDLSGQGTHPCYGEPVKAMRDGSYFYSFNGSNNLFPEEDTLTTSTSEKVEQHALLCMLEIDREQDPMVVGCTRDPDKQDERYYMVTLLARGEADCVGNNCGAEALISQKIGSSGPGGGSGGPGVPLTARTNVPLSGTVEVVPNPNGGGLGVPISTWANARLSDPPLITGARGATQTNAHAIKVTIACSATPRETTGNSVPISCPTPISPVICGYIRSAMTRTPNPIRRGISQGRSRDIS
jgi:hypothetical protein